MVAEPLVAADGFWSVAELKVGMLKPEAFGRSPSWGGALLMAVDLGACKR